MRRLAQSITIRQYGEWLLLDPTFSDGRNHPFEITREMLQKALDEAVLVKS